jgi:chromosome partitioning protein
MNTKGGVGKSTTTLAIAETLAVFHGKNVLVIDSDAQASVSAMLMSTMSLRKLQGDRRTIVDYLIAAVLHEEQTEWTEFVVGGVSDVDDAKSVYVMPSDMQLTLFEREVSKEAMHSRLRASIGGLLGRARIVFDVVLIDCPPGLSVLTECWLREADFHLSPTKPDYISVCGLDVFARFKQLNPEMGFAENIGVLVNMKDRHSAEDGEYHRWLASDPDNRCFEQALPRLNALQQAARYHSDGRRSFSAKYPGEIGVAVRGLAAEVLARMSGTVAVEAHDSGTMAAAAMTPPAKTTQAPTSQQPASVATAKAAPVAPAASPAKPAAHSKPATPAAKQPPAARPAATALASPRPPAAQQLPPQANSAPATAKVAAPPKKPVAAPAPVAPPQVPAKAPQATPPAPPVKATPPPGGR